MFTGEATAPSLLSLTTGRAQRLKIQPPDCCSALAVIPLQHKQPRKHKDGRPSGASSGARSLDIVSGDPLGPEVLVVVGGLGDASLFTQASVAAHECSIGLGRGDLGSRVPAPGPR